MIYKKIGVIGCGNMGQALIEGFLSSGLVPKTNLLGCETDIEKARAVAEKYSIQVTKDARGTVKVSDAIILAVKPQAVQEVLSEIKPCIDESKTIISIAAGITTTAIEEILGDEPRVVRGMPNTPALVKKGMSAVCDGKYAKLGDRQIAIDLLSCAGEVAVVEEKFMDAVTAISGSGPAYFFYIYEKLIEAAIEAGLPEATASKLVVQTALGAAHLIAYTKETPQALRAKVTSKGGTTEAAIKVLDESDINRIIKDAVKAARERSKTLSEDK